MCDTGCSETYSVAAGITLQETGHTTADSYSSSSATSDWQQTHDRLGGEAVGMNLLATSGGSVVHFQIGSTRRDTNRIMHNLEILVADIIEVWMDTLSDFRLAAGR